MSSDKSYHLPIIEFCGGYLSHLSGEAKDFSS